MAIPTELLTVIGNWTGPSKLNYSEDPDIENILESDSTLTIEADPLNAFATVTYTWTYEGQGHVGRLLICGDESNGEVTAGWSDSWHQNGGVLFLSGTGMDSDRVKVTGSYGAGEGPDWGWRIEMGPIGNNLELKMINITPDGEETWAVQADYSRA